MFHKERPFESWHGWMFLIIVVSALILGVVQKVTAPDQEEIREERGELTVLSCEEAGGAWNMCGSACRSAEVSEACIEVCVEYCECTSTNECPTGYGCVDVVNGIGVCF